jgi:hypothetical protein
MAGGLGLSAPPGRGIHDRSLIIGYLPRSFDVPPAVDALVSISHPPMSRPNPVEATGANDPGLRPGIASLEVAVAIERAVVSRTLTPPPLAKRR